MIENGEQSSPMSFWAKEIVVLEKSWTLAFGYVLGICGAAH